MNIAQGLYEGIDLGKEGPEGLITYMRTDSVRIVPEMISEVRDYIKKQYGPEYLDDEPRIYSTKKSAQDAHEAIRPTNLAHNPEAIKDFLSREQFMLYKLIWMRFIASQMKPAIYDTVTADIDAGDNIVVRATGSVIKFNGFLAVYEEKTDEDADQDESRMLPTLEAGKPLMLLELTSDQAFTRPPPRYTEASLVKELERLGIGRPSTYASIMNKIQSRDYTVKENGRLKPTELGRVIAELLEANFQKIMDIGFTAGMEDDLEKVASNEKDWKQLLRDFWKDFKPTLDSAEQSGFVPKVMTDLDCPTCGSKLQKIWYKSKYFYGCSRYPDCKFSAPAEEINFNKDDYAEDFNWDQKCPKCGSDMKLRHGRYGAFLGCTTYPECKGIVNIPKKGETVIPEGELPECPAIDCTGHMVARKSRYGKTFYSCSTFPECDVIVNDISQLNTKYPEHYKTPYVKKTKGKGAAKRGTAKKGEAAPKKKRIMAASKLSPELADVVGVPELSRGDAMKHLWDYIKTHKLQNSENKRIITPDEKLAKLFGSSEPIDMFKMAGIISKHMGK
jgi:DNA topoisomerase-1